jgi:lipoprotein LprG
VGRLAGVRGSRAGRLAPVLVLATAITLVACSPAVSVADTRALVQRAVGRTSALQSAQFQLDVGGISVETELVQVDGASYILSPFSRRWEALAGGLVPVPLLDPDRGITRLLRTLEAPRAEATDDVDRQHAWKLVGRIPAGEITALVGGTPTSGMADAESLLTADGLVRPLLLRGPVVDSESPEITRTFTFSHFDEPVLIDAPTV